MIPDTRTAAELPIRFSCQPLPPARPQPGLAVDVRQGLLEPPRSLSPKYFYDSRGSELFDRICDTPEYYLTRTEAGLLERCARDIVDRVRPRHILELGAGTSRKTRHLFDACQSERCHSVYAPFDVCEEVLVDAGRALVADYDWLEINALVGDYLAGLDHLPTMDGPRLFVFLGSTVGNFSTREAHAFLSHLRAQMAPEDWLLIGADRVKDPRTLHAAYNDAEGLTAAFNLNLLDVLNRELGGGFEPRQFRHHACYNPVDQQMEMYLVASTDQRVRLEALDETLEFREGEAVLTEVSRKFTPRSLGTLLRSAGFRFDEHYEAEDGAFSLVLARALRSAGLS